MTNLIEKYKTLRGAVGGSSAYVRKKEYTESTTNNYVAILESYISENYFRNNTALQEIIERAIEKLKKHKEFTFDYQTRSEEFDCECEEEYKGFQFYVDTCKSIQKIRDNNF